MNVHPDVSGSSFFRQAEGAATDGVPCTVPMRRLDALVPVDVSRLLLLKIDVRGAVLAVLDGLGVQLADVDAINVEASLLEFRTGAPLLSDIVRWFSDRDWVVYNLVGGEMRSLDGALAQVDVVFVPRTCPLRSDRRFFAEDQSTAYLRRLGVPGPR